MTTGPVAWFNVEKGSGIIGPDDGAGDVPPTMPRWSRDRRGRRRKHPADEVQRRPAHGSADLRTETL